MNKTAAQNTVINAQCSFDSVIRDFDVPRDLKNDIMYCQKNLRNYLAVQLMIHARMGDNVQNHAIAKKYIEEIEADIYEINAEQKFLLLRVRRVLEEFYKNLRRSRIIVDRAAGNEHICKIFTPLYDDLNFHNIQPVSVRKRLPEAQLFLRFNVDHLIRSQKSTSVVEKVKIASPERAPCLSTSSDGKNQVSLLKPKAERFVISPSQVDSIINPSPITTQDDTETKQEKTTKTTINTFSGESVNRSRLNLRQALNKAKSQNLAIASTLPAAPAPPPTNKIKCQPESIKRSPEQSSSSEESYELTPERVEPLEYNQEMFLRYFGLNTLAHSTYLQQRRSKRKRRNVQSTARTDYHYGHIEFDHSTQFGGKKRKTLLLSPPMLRKRQQGYGTTAAGSSSSSPEQKYTCNECTKSEGTVANCEQCNGFFHVKCHSTSSKGVSDKILHSNCPACYRRSKTNAEPTSSVDDEKLPPKRQRLTLLGQHEELKAKLNKEKIRRKSLLKQSEYYKRKMTQLLSIVGSMKNEVSEHDEDADVVEVDDIDDADDASNSN